MRQPSSDRCTFDSIISRGLKFFQPAEGFRINIDTLILYDFTLRYIKGGILEIGSAAGILSILLSKYSKSLNVTGVEVNKELFRLSLNNLELHHCKDTVEFINADINEYKNLFKPQTFDFIVTNPPFYKCGTGRISPKHGVDIAHHDRLLTLENLFSAGRYLLKPNGCLIMIFPSFRIGEIFPNARGFAVEVLRFIHRTSSKSSDIFLMLAKKGGGRQLNIIPPLIVHEGDGYSTEITTMLNP